MGSMHGRANATGRRRKEARPRELLDAALALFVEKGFAGSRAEDIAARAGVSKATLYLYFASKDDLLKGLIADGFSSHVGIGEREITDWFLRSSSCACTDTQSVRIFRLTPRHAFPSCSASTSSSFLKA